MIGMSVTTAAHDNHFLGCLSHVELDMDLKANAR